MNDEKRDGARHHVAKAGEEAEHQIEAEAELVPGTLNWSSIMRAMKRTWARRCSWVSFVL